MTDEEKLAQIMAMDHVLVSSDVMAMVLREVAAGRDLCGVRIEECKWLAPGTIAGVNEPKMPSLDTTELPPPRRS